MAAQRVTLTTTGRTTGRQIDVRLYAAADGDRLVVVASNGGKATDPAWVANLRANAGVSVRLGRRVLAMRAREVEGAERDRLWALAAAAFPLYEAYARRTERRIPVFALEPSA
jgi:deazaflavin-dependent oxidoreductase (nitroreductase family)